MCLLCFERMPGPEKLLQPRQSIAPVLHVLYGKFPAQNGGFSIRQAIGATCFNEFGAMQL
jgi:hypothetical protein